ncbi:hypothetical protein GGE07_000396 [Sinorhizobium terangae]|nr:hypothetical protein [Sinorhizobium terangae]MBB4183783.1 hypothetical protein [Sinorhizobium terangae]
MPDEIPRTNTIIGGSIVLFALFPYLAVELWRQRRLRTETGASP